MSADSNASSSRCIIPAPPELPRGNVVSWDEARLVPATGRQSLPTVGRRGDKMTFAVSETESTAESDRQLELDAAASQLLNRWGMHIKSFESLAYAARQSWVWLLHAAWASLPRRPHSWKTVVDFAMASIPSWSLLGGWDRELLRIDLVDMASQAIASDSCTYPGATWFSSPRQSTTEVPDITRSVEV